jgi:hypothetical protein
VTLQISVSARDEGGKVVTSERTGSPMNQLCVTGTDEHGAVIVVSEGLCNKTKELT